MEIKRITDYIYQIIDHNNRIDYFVTCNSKEPNHRLFVNRIYKNSKTQRYTENDNCI